MMLENDVSAFVQDLLLDVPLARKQGTPEEFLAVLRDSALFYPVFSGRSPVDSWLDEAESLSRELNASEILADILIRRAVVRMRRLELDAALAQLDELEGQGLRLNREQRTWAAVTRGRIQTRQHQFKAAARALNGVQPPPPESWTRTLPQIARGELQLETGEMGAAEITLVEAKKTLLPELIEERVQVAQLLGYIAIAQANAPKALALLDEARQLLRGAAAWTEIIQMNLVVGGFRLTEGDRATAEALFEEGLALCEEYPQPELETLLRLSLARLRAAEGRTDDAVNAALQAATLYAKQGSVLGYVSMILYMARIYSEDKRYESAYRTLATGLGIARHKGWSPAEAAFRAQVNQLRDKVLGAEKFDAMVQRMLDEAKGQQQ